MKGAYKDWLPNGCLGLLCGVAALALLVVSPSFAHGACIGMGCEGPVREAYIICCNQLVYEPRKEGVGADRTIDCDDYLRKNVWPESVGSICKQLKDMGGLCPEAAATCSSPKQNGNDCYGRMPGKGGLFAQSTTKPSARIHSEPSSNSPEVSYAVNGSRLIYHQMIQVNGQTWYYVHPPGKPGGWVSNSEVSCTRPEVRMIPTYPPNHPPDLPVYRSNASYGGARG